MRRGRAICEPFSLFLGVRCPAAAFTEVDRIALPTCRAISTSDRQRRPRNTQFISGSRYRHWHRPNSVHHHPTRVMKFLLKLSTVRSSETNFALQRFVFCVHELAPVPFYVPTLVYKKKNVRDARLAAPYPAAPLD